MYTGGTNKCDEHHYASEEKESEFLIDSGASFHMCASGAIRMMTNAQNTAEQKTSTANNEPSVSTTIGDVPVKLTKNVRNILTI